MTEFVLKNEKIDCEESKNGAMTESFHNITVPDTDCVKSYRSYHILSLLAVLMFTKFLFIMKLLDSAPNILAISIVTNNVL